MPKTTTGSTLYRAFLKACGSWRDPNPCAPHPPEVGRNWCMACYFKARHIKADHNLDSPACLLNRRNAA